MAPVRHGVPTARNGRSTWRAGRCKDYNATRDQSESARELHFMRCRRPDCQSSHAINAVATDRSRGWCFRFWLLGASSWSVRRLGFWWECSRWLRVVRRELAVAIASVGGWFSGVRRYGLLALDVNDCGADADRPMPMRSASVLTGCAPPADSNPTFALAALPGRFSPGCRFQQLGVAFFASCLFSSIRSITRRGGTTSSTCGGYMEY